MRDFRVLLRCETSVWAVWHAACGVLLCGVQHAAVWSVACHVRVHARAACVCVFRVPCVVCRQVTLERIEFAWI